MSDAHHTPEANAVPAPPAPETADARRRRQLRAAAAAEAGYILSMRTAVSSDIERPERSTSNTGTASGRAAAWER